MSIPGNIFAPADNGNKLSLLGGRLSAVFAVFIASLWLRDLFFFFAFATHIELIRSIGWAVFALSLPAGIVLSVRHVEPDRERCTWLGFIVLAFLALLALSRSVFPDMNIDTLNYHIFLQQQPLLDNVHDNFFPCRSWTFSFPLGDAPFRIFRFLLGYRLGTFLNMLLTALLYIQSRNLIRIYVRSRAIQMPAIATDALAFIAVSTEQILLTFGTYLIDSLVIPLMLESLGLLIFSSKPAADGTRTENGLAVHLIAGSCGMSVALKLTNIPFAAVIMLLTLFRHREYVSAKAGKRIAALFALLAIPALPYAAYNYASVLNPVYPFANTVFKSPWYALKEFRLHIAPQNIAEILAWPLIGMLHPERVSRVEIYSGQLIIPVIAILLACAWLLAKKLRSQSDEDTPLLMSMLFFAISLPLWIKVFFLARYAALLEMYGDIILSMLIIRLFAHGKMISRTAGAAAFALCAMQTVYCYYLVINKNTDYSWRPAAWSDRKACADNLSLFGRDRSMPKEEQKILDTVGLWVLDGPSSVYTLLNGKAPAVNLGLLGDDTPARKDFVISAAKAALTRFKDKKNFTIADNSSAGYTLKTLRKYGFTPVSATALHPYFLPKGNVLMLFELSASTVSLAGDTEADLPPDQRPEITDLEVSIIPELGDRRTKLLSKSFPEDRYALLSIADLYLRGGWINKARWYAEAASRGFTQIQDNNPFPDLTMGNLLEAEGKYKDAYLMHISALEKARFLGIQNPFFEQARQRVERTIYSLAMELPSKEEIAAQKHKPFADFTALVSEKDAEITEADIKAIPQLEQLRKELSAKNSPDNRYAQLFIASAYLSGGYYPKALWHAEAASKAFSAGENNNPYPDFTLGAIMEKRGMYCDAYKLYAAAAAKGEIVKDFNPAFQAALSNLSAKMSPQDKAKADKFVTAMKTELSAKQSHDRPAVSKQHVATSRQPTPDDIGSNLRSARLVSGWHLWGDKSIWMARVSEADFKSGSGGKAVLSAYLPGNLPARKLSLFCDGNPLGNYSIAPGAVHIEAQGLPPNRIVRLKIELDKSVVPADAGLGADKRELGLLFSDIVLN
ncbi:MAG: hypothetical protein WC421_05965 [Elusimicrobiales bacterium]